MTLAIEKIRTIYRHNGVELQVPPGSSWEDARDLHCGFYSDLIGAVPRFGEILNGVQEVTFEKTVGTKGAAPSLKAYLAHLDGLARGVTQGPHAELATQLDTDAGRALGKAWNDFAGATDAVRQERRLPPSGALAPLA